MEGRNEIIYYKWLGDEKVPCIHNIAAVKPSPVLVWTGYDDVRSLDFKVRYLMDNDFGGAMLFSLNYDDFTGQCFQLEFPLMRVINFHLNPRIKVEYPNPNKIFHIRDERLRRSRDAKRLGLMNSQTNNSNEI